MNKSLFIITKIEKYKKGLITKSELLFFLKVKNRHDLISLKSSFKTNLLYCPYKTDHLGIPNDYHLTESEDVVVEKKELVLV